ncbi:MAG: hypothetical protein LBF68_05630 [Christensenellaceae bacterium]|jgi:hypothetical protein|nr:hypothetical protein [Christensenellaceae bacterium]
MTVKTRRFSIIIFICAVFITALVTIVSFTNNFATAKITYPGLEFPIAENSGNITYDPTKTLADFNLINGSTSAGTFVWKYPGLTPTCNVTLYDVVFTPFDQSNYEIETKAVELIIKKATPTSITFPEITQTHTYSVNLKLQDIQFTNGAGDGNFSWNNGENELLTVGTKSYTLTFTPRDLINYDYSSYSSLSKNYTITITPAVGSVVFPTHLNIVYEPNKTLGDIDIVEKASVDSGGKVGGNGSFYWKTPTTVISTSLTNSLVVFVPNPNYSFEDQTFERSITIVIDKATPPNLVFPTANSIIYAPTKQLSQIALIDGLGDGKFDWKYPTTIPQVTINSYLVVFVPRDSNNYDYQDVACEAMVTLLVEKATPDTIIFPSAPTMITYNPNHTLINIPLSGGAGDGGFSWASPNTVPVVAITDYVILFTPRDEVNYNYTEIPRTHTVQITVQKAIPVNVIFPTTQAVTYDPTSSLENVAFVRESGSGDGSFQWTTPSIVPSASVSSYQVKFTPSDIANYEILYSMIDLQVNKLQLSEVSDHGVQFPSILGAVQYDPTSTLSNIAINGITSTYTGTFNWADPNIIPTVNVTQYDAVFVPDDANIIGLTYKITLTVQKAIATSFPRPDDFTLPFTYTESLSLLDITFSNNSEGSYEWTNHNINPFVNNDGYTAVFVPYNNSNYDYSELETLEFTVIPLISPKTLSPSEYTIPTDLRATYGDTLSDIILPNGFNWEIPENTQVGPVGNRVFSASYHPTTNSQNYVTITNIALTITVEKATNSAQPSASDVKVAKKSGSSIVFESDKALEYSIDGGKTWQSSPVFTELTPQKEYKFLVRIKEDEFYLASANWQEIVIKTPMSGFLAALIVIAGFLVAGIIFAIVYYLCVKRQTDKKL